MQEKWQNPMTKEEAIEVLDDMKVKIDIPKSAVTQHKRNEALDMAISALSADVRPNIHGHWERPTGKITPFGDETIQCTECGFFTEEDSIYVYNFCPNCGADMREPKCETCKNCNKAIGCSKHIACQRENMKFHEPIGEKGTE